MESGTAGDLFELGAIIFGLTEVFKEFVPKEYRKKVTPLISLIIGSGANIYLHGYTPENVVYGLALGLAASGLYKAFRSTIQTAGSVKNGAKV